MTTNRDAALNTVYQSKLLAYNAVGSLYDAGEITREEWCYARPRRVGSGWGIYLKSPYGLSRDTTEESNQ
jgi:hypothetical protein